ncbi:MAG: N-acetyltransferase family protein [Alcanivorax sp.]|uniref:GNAT family N-acetyltransferase n=1 Tax=Alcanivorax sp. TaxID=1872427 RepID=UPI003DA71986
MTDKPYFRLYRPGDFQALVTMVMALYREDPPGEAMNATKVTHTVTALSRAPEKGRIMIFDMDDEVVGYAIVIHCWSNEFSGDIHLLDEIYITPHKHNLGIGTAFLQHLLKQMGESAIGLKVEITPDNNRARRFYETLGFTAATNRHLFMPLPRH